MTLTNLPGHMQQPAMHAARVVNIRKCRQKLLQTLANLLGHLFIILLCVQPGYLASQIPREPPQQGEAWANIMQDVEEKIMPGAPRKPALLLTPV